MTKREAELLIERIAASTLLIEDALNVISRFKDMGSTEFAHALQCACDINRNIRFDTRRLLKLEQEDEAAMRTAYSASVAAVDCIRLSEAAPERSKGCRVDAENNLATIQSVIERCLADDPIGI